MKFGFKWSLICSGQATDRILNNLNMLSHMEGTICDSIFFIKVSLLSPFSLPKQIIDKAVSHEHFSASLLSQ